MASIAWEGENGDFARITFRDAAGRQKSLRLGRCTKRTAQGALTGFERVVESFRAGTTMHPDALRWLESIDDRIHARVAALGLTQPRKPREVVRLGALLERFDAAAVVKSGTLTVYRQATAMLREHFGENRDVATITPADADAWRKALADSGLAAATVAKRVRVAKAVFQKAVKWGMLASNPLADLRSGSQANPERAHYVSPATIRAILAACPNDEWRAVVALTRYAGLRCPSEIGLLRWGDVNWERGRLTVRSPKTEGHEGHAVRVVPIAPELRPILQDLFDHAEPGAEAVVPRLADPTVNRRTQFERIIAKAGEKPWPRLFHNLRASCATDWVERFPAHTVAAWLGHSPMIAATHYLQTRDSHFDAAAGLGNPATEAATKAATDTRPGAPMRSQSNAGRDAGDDSEVLCTVGVGSGSDSVGAPTQTPRDCSRGVGSDPKGIRTPVFRMRT
jgi:integrase